MLITKAMTVRKGFKVYQAKNPKVRLFKHRSKYVIKRDISMHTTKANYSSTVFNNSYSLLCYLERSM